MCLDLNDSEEKFCLNIIGTNQRAPATSFSVFAFWGTKAVV